MQEYSRVLVESVTKESSSGAMVPNTALLLLFPPSHRGAASNTRGGREANNHASRIWALAKGRGEPVAQPTLLVIAAPVFAGEGGAFQFKGENCGTGIADPPEGDRCHVVFTPSGNTQAQVHDKSEADGPSSGGGAVHEDPSCIDPQQQGGAVTTPSGNTNVHCTGTDKSE
jgi:hypothetical protein